MPYKNIKKFFYLTLVVFLMTSKIVSSQSLMGYNGYFRIPTAIENKDGEISFTLLHIDRRISVLESGISPNLRAVLSLNYLPFLEINLILNNLVNSSSPEQAVGDRQSSFKFIFSDLGILPNIAIGFYDALGSTADKSGVHSDFFYITNTKTIKIIPGLDSEFSLGYATTLYHEQNTGLSGLFGGIAVNFLESIKVYAEYDTKYYNIGTNIRLFNHAILNVGYLDGKYFSGGAGFCYQL